MPALRAEIRRPPQDVSQLPPRPLSRDDAHAHAEAQEEEEEAADAHAHAVAQEEQEDAADAHAHAVAQEEQEEAVDAHAHAPAHAIAQEEEDEAADARFAFGHRDGDGRSARPKTKENQHKLHDNDDHDNDNHDGRERDGNRRGAGAGVADSEGVAAMVDDNDDARNRAARCSHYRARAAARVLCGRGHYRNRARHGV